MKLIVVSILLSVLLESALAQENSSTIGNVTFEETLKLFYVHIKYYNGTDTFCANEVKEEAVAIEVIIDRVDPLSKGPADCFQRGLFPWTLTFNPNYGAVCAYAEDSTSDLIFANTWGVQPMDINCNYNGIGCQPPAINCVFSIGALFVEGTNNYCIPNYFPGFRIKPIRCFKTAEEAIDAGLTLVNGSSRYSVSIMAIFLAIMNFLLFHK